METPCVIWTGKTSSSGYGVIRVPCEPHTVYGKTIRSRSVMAHRHAFEQANGPIPEGMIVRHDCDERRCVNVDHMRLGAPQDDVDDMWARGRAWAQNRPTTERPGNERLHMLVAEIYG